MNEQLKHSQNAQVAAAKSLTAITKIIKDTDACKECALLETAAVALRLFQKSMSEEGPPMSDMEALAAFMQRLERVHIETVNLAEPAAQTH